MLIYGKCILILTSNVLSDTSTNGSMLGVSVMRKYVGRWWTIEGI